MRITKIKTEELEFCLIKEGFSCDYRQIYCRKRPKNKFVGFFIPWKKIKRAYNTIPGYTTEFDIEDAKVILDKIKTWEDLEKWNREQKLKATANYVAIEKEWDNLKLNNARR